VGVCCGEDEPVIGNWKPVIGVVTQPLGDGKQAIIAASYVKFIEAGGGRAVPVHFDSSQEKLEFYFNSLNGILFPGGGADLSPSGKFQAAQSFFYRRTMKAFDEDGDYFPIWGTCLGFEALVQLVSNNASLVKTFPIEDINTSHKLRFCQPSKRSKLFPPLIETPPAGTCRAQEPEGQDDHEVDGDDHPKQHYFLGSKRAADRRKKERDNKGQGTSPSGGAVRTYATGTGNSSALFDVSYMINSLESQPLVYFNHKRGATFLEWNNNEELNDFFEILTTTTVRGVDFVSTMEARRYPIYGVLYHPEKNLFESSPSVEAPSSLMATVVGQYFASFLVEEARRSRHRFPTMTSLRDNLIYRHSPQDTTNNNGSWWFDETYFFDLDGSEDEKTNPTNGPDAAVQQQEAAAAAALLVEE